MKDWMCKMKYILKNNFESTMINTYLLLMALLTFMLLEFDYCLGVNIAVKITSH